MKMKNNSVKKPEPKLNIKSLIQAISVRLVLVVHSIFTTWRAADVMKNDFYWCLALVNILLFFELVFTIHIRKAQEGKWFCPCFLLYLCSTLPSIWLLETDRLDRYGNTVSGTNLTEVTEALSTVRGITIPIALTPDTWIQLLEQSMMFLLIIGRWFLPRGDLTRNELSQLLFVYLGTGSDILELFIVFEESEVREDLLLSYITLIIWSFSLLQFTFVITATRSSHRPRVFLVDEESQSVRKRKSILRKNNCVSTMFATEVWGLLLSTIIIDIPFLSLRLYILIARRILSYGILFFACKNAILILVVIYRICIISCCNETKEVEKKYRISGEIQKHNKSNDVCLK